MLPLKERKCEPLEKGKNPFDKEKIREYMEMLQPGWHVSDDKKISRKFLFENFKRAMAFVQEVARIAEQEQHHPDICISYADVEIELSTHDVGGLSENDFILAAKIDSF
ncbi:MAG: 4a-hydroxytetrahydrobiopterin dehydratase [Bacteroidales bacterium]|nr:4a-hydroxytetrahydrobiopterin dehydratase [Bacteroidales bacterium]